MQVAALKKNKGTLITLLLALIYYVVTRPHMNDFSTFYEWGQVWMAGGSLTAPSPTEGMRVFYIPYFAPFVALFSLLPYSWAALLWFLLKVILYICCIHTVKKLRPEMRPWQVTFTFLLFLGLVDSDVKTGQINSLVMTTSFLAFFATANIWIRSLLYAFATVKVTPLIYIPLFAFFKKNRLLLNALTIVALLIAVTCIVAGLSPVTVFKEWVLSANQEKLQGSESTILANQSYYGALCRILASDATAKITWAFTGLLTAVVGGLFFLKKKPSPWYAFSLFSCLMLFFSPDTRQIHEIHLLIPMLALFIETKSPHAWNRRAAITGIVLFLASVIVTHPQVFPTETQNIFMQANLHTGLILAFVIIFASFIYKEAR